MSSGLWGDHPATPWQSALVSGDKSRDRAARLSQADVLVAMLRNARSRGLAVELPAIMATGIAQHGARFNEIRSRGFIVENETERVSDGRVLSRYCLRFDPEQDGGQ